MSVQNAAAENAEHENTVTIQFQTLSKTRGEVTITGETTFTELRAKVGERLSLSPEVSANLTLLHRGRVIRQTGTPVLDYEPIKQFNMIVVVIPTLRPPSAAEGRAVTAGGEASNDADQEVSANTSGLAMGTTAATAPSVGGRPMVLPVNGESATNSNNQSNRATTPSAPSRVEYELTDEQKALVEQLCNMGFEEEQVKRALAAAFYNAERAVEYLTSGIPDNVDGLEEGIDMPSVSEVLTNLPFIQELRAAWRQNPAVIPEIIASIRERHVDFADFLSNHYSELLQVLAEDHQPNQNTTVPPIPEGVQRGIPTGLPVLQSVPPVDAPSAPVATTANQATAEASASDPPQNNIEVSFTVAEADSIRRLVDMGFSQAAVVEAFMACDKNEELAANYLIDNFTMSN